jgi:hypothetical protein
MGALYHAVKGSSVHIWIWHGMETPFFRWLEEASRRSSSVWLTSRVQIIESGSRFDNRSLYLCLTIQISCIISMIKADLRTSLLQGINPWTFKGTIPPWILFVQQYIPSVISFVFIYLSIMVNHFFKSSRWNMSNPFSLQCLLLHCFYIENS